MVAMRSAITATVASSAAPGCVRPSHLIVFTGQWWTVPWYVRILRITQSRVRGGARAWRRSETGGSAPGSRRLATCRITAASRDLLWASRPRHWSGLEQRTSRWTTWQKVAVAGLARMFALTGDRDLVPAPW